MFLFSFISTSWHQYNLRINLLETRAFWRYSICHGSTRSKWFVLRKATNTHNNCHNHGCCRRKWPPNNSNEASSLTMTCQMDGQQPPEQADIIWGEVRGCMALKALLCSRDDALLHYWSVLRAIHLLNPPSLKLYLLAWGVAAHQAKTTAWVPRLHVGTRGHFR